MGTIALMKDGSGKFEIAKLSVSNLWQGKGISKSLMETCLNKAKALSVKKLLLYSNHQLLTALSLYKKYGFRHVDPADSPFETADVKMELEL